MSSDLPTQPHPVDAAKARRSLRNGFITLALAGGLTMSVFVTKKDFSFIGPALWTLSWVAFAVIIAGAFFGAAGAGLKCSGARICSTYPLACSSAFRRSRIVPECLFTLSGNSPPGHFHIE